MRIEKHSRYDVKVDARRDYEAQPPTWERVEVWLDEDESARLERGEHHLSTVLNRLAPLGGSFLVHTVTGEIEVDDVAPGGVFGVKE